jgi:CHAT domain-containing protein
MRLADLAARLVAADDAERAALLAANSASVGVELARALKDICLDGWSTHPAQALGAASSLRLVSQQNSDPEIVALESWTRGLAELVQGRMEAAITALNLSESQFLIIDKSHDAAATQVSKLVALAMLGLYDDAIACGLEAGVVLVNHGDLLNAGKIEHNIGNIYFRRDQYGEAEKFQKLARERFVALNDASHLTKIENSLALTLTQQHKLREAEELYEQALKRAESANQLSTQAAIESSIGTMALYRGRYDRALDYLERSRRNYGRLGMAHLSALTEQEIADAYLELNLIPECAEIYQRLDKTFAELGMRAEEARSLTHHARAEVVMGRAADAESLLNRAAELFTHEKNHVGQAMVNLTQAQLLYAQHHYERARESASAAEPAFAAAGAQRRLLFARWLHAEASRSAGSTTEALQILKDTQAQAEQDQPDLVARCLTSIGLTQVATGDRQAAEHSFKKAAKVIENLRAPLPGEEFRTSFFADKLTPYHELMRLCLDSGRHAEAFRYSELSRSRTLADALGNELSLTAGVTDEAERELIHQLEVSREELNYLYRQENVADDSSAGSRQKLRHEIQVRERWLLELTRQVQHRTPQAGHAAAIDVARFQEQLGTDTTLIEYATLDDEIVAFIVTADDIKGVRNLTRQSDVVEEITQFRFQIDALRFGSAAIRRHLASLTARASKHLESLFSKLWAPLRENITSQNVVIVPHGILHYLPFQGLYDGERYLIEQHEISYSPSAGVLQQTRQRPQRGSERALLVGVADAAIPHVNDEIAALQHVFPKSVSLLNGQATAEALRKQSTDVDVLHLACHARFRSDNPLFSSLQLSDGPFTVRDALQLNLKGTLVTLSACETGVNAIIPGDELIGLARGFFSAGAASVLLSLWTVDDEATRQIMEEFYRQIRGGSSAARALRLAQMQLMKRQEHPYFWAPFILVGRR